MLRFSVRILRAVLIGLVLLVAALLVLGWASYGATFGGAYEQNWLNDCIHHLQVMRTHCLDPELQDVLDYTITRYNCIGPFDVAVTRIPSLLGDDVFGCNNPLIPGISIDLEVLSHSVHVGAMIIVHEALHDYWPYAGHAHVDPIMGRLEMLSDAPRMPR